MLLFYSIATKYELNNLSQKNIKHFNTFAVFMVIKFLKLDVFVLLFFK